MANTSSLRSNGGPKLCRRRRRIRPCHPGLQIRKHFPRNGERHAHPHSRSTGNQRHRHRNPTTSSVLRMRGLVDHTTEDVCVF